MMVHIHKGKGDHDRGVPLSQKLLQTLRVYWRLMKPKTYLFPDTVKNWPADVSVARPYLDFTTEPAPLDHSLQRLTFSRMAWEQAFETNGVGLLASIGRLTSISFQ